MKPKQSPSGALKSMTGYAQARREQDGWALRVSLRSVNHRFLDLHLRLPDGMDMFEPRIRQRVRERLRRGHVDVTLHYELAGPAAVQLNHDVAEAYLKAATQLRKKFKLKAEPDLGSLLRLPGVIAAGGLSSGMLDDEEQERLGRQVDACLEEALERLEEMRRAEGRQLAAEMKGQLTQIGERCEKIERLAEKSRPAYARRLQSRMQELLGETALDPIRLAQEAALLAERADICEETARLRSHVTQFRSLLAGTGEAGKKLDFLLQEMQREANTMLSKTPGVEGEGLAITDLALEVKSEIEKLREQVQNVE
jgi:uncharacterized protein (TIGR00255 family)